jgi:uncharacterized protein with GYD domain
MLKGIPHEDAALAAQAGIDVIIADVPDDESMSAIALAIAAGGALKASKTTKLLTGAQGVEALKKAEAVAKTYRPAR